MVIHTLVPFKAYVKLLFTLTYRKPIMILLVSVAILLVLWIIDYRLNIFTLPAPSYYQYFTLFLIGIVQPSVIYNNIYKNYHSSSHLKEKLKIEFTPTQIKITGESFYTELAWQKIFKVLELNNWFLIFQNNFSAIIIPKKVLQPNEAEFVALVKSIKGIHTNLKNNH